MSFPNGGKIFPHQAENQQASAGAAALTNFAGAMSKALNRDFAGSSKIKTVAKLTGANERTVKNWFSGAYGPSGSYLVLLSRHSNKVLEVFLALAGRDGLLQESEIAHLEERLIDLLSQHRSQIDENSDTT